MNRTRTALTTLGTWAVSAGLILATTAGCTSDADKASQNLSTAAEQFEVQRRITVVNTFTNEVTFETEGRCSIERESKTLIVTCKHGESDYRKHYTGLGDNGMYQSTQLDPIDVDVYHTRIIIKPETVLPDFDLETSGDIEGDG
jgi:hypothetical protein